MENQYQPAFPHVWDTNTEYVKADGLNKREYFAAMAMQGILASKTEASAIGSLGMNEDFTVIAKQSIIIADEFLKQLEM